LPFEFAVSEGYEQLTPHPSRDGWRKRRRETPSPQGLSMSDIFCWTPGVHMF